jgi:hypothetical protein
MKTIRRIYLYAVAFVSLETVLWGTINLARSMAAGRTVAGNTSQLAGALSLILVGVPVFLLHWWFAQRLALQEVEERSARIRAIFLYGSVLAAGIPVAQNVLALASRLLSFAFGLTAQAAFIGGNQTISDNLIAILMNAVVAAYLLKVAAGDWQALSESESLADTRRLFRYVWLIYGLGWLAFGVQQTIAYIFSLPQAIDFGSRSMLADGLASLLVGAPVWVYFQRKIENTLDDHTERESPLRLAILFILALGGVGVVLGASGLVLYQLLRGLFGAGWSLGELLAELSYPFSVAVPAGTIWAFYGRLFNFELITLTDQIQRELLRRLYRYLLSFMGLGATFFGVQGLLAYILNTLLGFQSSLGPGLGNRLAGAFALLTVGLPLWIFSWGTISALARLEGEAGDRARRSLIRKTYLYGILFVGVIGLMISAGALLFQLISALLGDPQEQLLRQTSQLLGWMVLFSIFLIYHWRAMQADNRLAEKALARRYSLFPVLVLAEEGVDSDFSAAMLEALERHAPALPVAVHSYSQGVPDETLSAARAVILPAELVARPSEALRLWLQGFDGPRVVVPTQAEGWLWVFGSGRTLKSLANQAARTIRELAEDEPIASPREASSWMAVIYILAGLAALQIGLLVVSLIASVLFR